MTATLTKIWETSTDDLQSPYLEHQRRVKDHLKKVEVLMETHMKKTLDKSRAEQMENWDERETRREQQQKSVEQWKYPCILMD